MPKQVVGAGPVKVVHGVGSRHRMQGRDARPRLSGIHDPGGAVELRARVALERALRAAARGEENLLYPMKEALRTGATLGEVSDALRDVFGVYQP